MEFVIVARSAQHFVHARLIIEQLLRNHLLDLAMRNQASPGYLGILVVLD